MKQRNPTYLKIPDENEYKRTIIVGDIHGCFDELKSLLDLVNFSSSDLLISVGDLGGQGRQLNAGILWPDRRLTIACSGQVLGTALICPHQGFMFEARSRVGGPGGVTCR